MSEQDVVDAIREAEEALDFVQKELIALTGEGVGDPGYYFDLLLEEDGLSDRIYMLRARLTGLRPAHRGETDA